jgi:hypothetical protein
MREIRVRGDIGAERVVLLADTAAGVVVPPRKGSIATLARVGVDGQASKVKLKLPKSGPAASLLREGLWLDGMFETKSGELGGWVTGAGPFVGIRIGKDGTVRVGEVQSDIERVQLSGPFALLRSEYGGALETVDGGLSWREVPLLDAKRSSTTIPSSEERGCSRVGCAFTHWLRVGWSGKGPAREMKEAEAPERTSIPDPGGGRWSLECWPTGEASRAALPLKSASEIRDAVERMRAMITARGARAPAVLSGTSWEPFLEVPAPRLPDKHLGFDVSVDSGSDDMRAYVWGQRGARWDRTGRFLVRALDRFSVRDGVWSSKQLSTARAHYRLSS